MSRMCSCTMSICPASMSSAAASLRVIVCSTRNHTAEWTGKTLDAAGMLYLLLACCTCYEKRVAKAYRPSCRTFWRRIARSSYFEQCPFHLPVEVGSFSARVRSEIACYVHNQYEKTKRSTGPKNYRPLRILISNPIYVWC